MREPACWTIAIGSSRIAPQIRFLFVTSGLEALFDESAGGRNVLAEGNAVVAFIDADVD